MPQAERPVMQAAREAAGNRKDRPKLLGVTVLTSFDAATLQEIGMSGTIESRAVALARLAKHAGLDGAVCSALGSAGDSARLRPKVRDTHSRSSSVPWRGE